MNVEEHQRLWDLMLVQAWQAFSEMNNLCDQFIAQTRIKVVPGFALDALSPLKRVPRTPRGIGKPVRRRGAGRRRVRAETIGAAIIGDFKKRYTRMYGGTKMPAPNRHRHNRGPK